MCGILTVGHTIYVARQIFEGQAELFIPEQFSPSRCERTKALSRQPAADVGTDANGEAAPF